MKGPLPVLWRAICQTCEGPFARPVEGPLARPVECPIARPPEAFLPDLLSSYSQICEKPFAKPVEDPLASSVVDPLARLMECPPCQASGEGPSSYTCEGLAWKGLFVESILFLGL